MNSKIFSLKQNIIQNIYVFIGYIGAIINTLHREKYRDFTKFPGVEILWKGTVSA